MGLRCCQVPYTFCHVSFWYLQSLAVVTLGDKQMAQRIDNLVDLEDVKRFYLQVCACA